MSVAYPQNAGRENLVIDSMENIETLCIMVYNVINKTNFLYQL